MRQQQTLNYHQVNYPNMSDFKEKVGSKKPEYIAAIQKNIASYENEIKQMDTVLENIMITGKATIFDEEVNWGLKKRSCLALFVRLAFQEEKRKKYGRCVSALKRKINELTWDSTKAKPLDQWTIDKAKEYPAESILREHGIEIKHDVIQCLDHRDSTPSMHVYKNNVHCFACGAHYDSIGLLRKLEGISFVEAVKSLANVL